MYERHIEKEEETQTPKQNGLTEQMYEAAQRYGRKNGMNEVPVTYRKSGKPVTGSEPTSDEVTVMVPVL